MIKKIICGILVSTITAFAVNNSIYVIETNKGEIEVLLHEKKAPWAVKNFKKLSDKGYYNYNKFYRVVKGFYIQTGDPTGTGRGGNSIWGKPFKQEISKEDNFNSKGVLAMSAKKGTNSSQFFITTEAKPKLNNKYTIVGHVTKGMETVTEIENVKVNTSKRPIKNVFIKRIYKKKIESKSEKDKIYKEKMANYKNLNKKEKELVDKESLKRASEDPISNNDMPYFQKRDQKSIKEYSGAKESVGIKFN